MPVVTLAEIDATGRKAARGCGCPWGLAEEAGKSARWLASYGLPGGETLSDLLANRTECCTKNGPPCVLRLAAALADSAPEFDREQIETCDKGTVLFLLAQLGRTADALDCTFSLRWGGGEATVARNSLSISGETNASSVTCHVIDSPAGNTRSPSPASRPVRDDAWTALTHLSHRILVPTSDASRAGAGAGTRDTD